MVKEKSGSPQGGRRGRCQGRVTLVIQADRGRMVMGDPNMTGGPNNDRGRTGPHGHVTEL